MEILGHIVYRSCYVGLNTLSEISLKPLTSENSSGLVKIYDGLMKFEYDCTEIQVSNSHSGKWKEKFLVQTVNSAVFTPQSKSILSGYCHWQGGLV